MHRHFVTTQTIEGAEIKLERGEMKHLTQVLRLKRGDEVMLFDGAGRERRCVIAALDRSFMGLCPLESPRTIPPHRCALRLFAAVSKAQRMDWTVEKSVELGVSEIVPILSANVITRVTSPRDLAAKRERWQRIAIEAARQCASAYVPKICEPIAFEEALGKVGDCAFVGALTPDAIPLRDAISAANKPESATWIVGPEGDFSAAEYAALRETGAKFVSLGPLVLRTETAAIYGLVALGCAWL